MKFRGILPWAPVCVLFPALLIAGEASDQSAVAQAESTAVPPGIVAFFASGGCPPGWTSAEQAEGRVVIGATQPADVGESLGEALSGSSLPSHVHDYDLARVFSPLTHLAGSTVLETVAPGTEVEYAGRSTPSIIQLPFLQTPACRPLLP